jgi:carbonic anhydrase
MAQLPKRLLDGYSAFKSGRFESDRERYHKLAEIGQKPKIMLIGCCDSRATPEQIFDAGPGEMFIVRNVANLVPPAQKEDDYHGTPAALEFAIQALKVEHIVVMGHGQCGGVKAFLDDEFQPLSEGDYISKWVSLLKPACCDDKFDELKREDLDRQGLLERSSVIQSLDNLRTFPCVRELEKEGKLSLHGAWFNIATGDLEYFEKDQDTFVKIDG